MRKLFGMMMVCVAVVACVPVITSAPGGGFTVRKDPRPLEVIASDAAITTKINASYVNDDVVSATSINVDTYESAVTLRGTVVNIKAKTRAIALAQGVKGVKSVDSQLKIGQ